MSLGELIYPRGVIRVHVFALNARISCQQENQNLAWSCCIILDRGRVEIQWSDHVDE